MILDAIRLLLFPALIAKNVDRAALAERISSMVDEHQQVASLLQQVRAWSDDLTPPEWACNSYRTLFAELKELESDVFLHFHLETHLLAPRFSGP